MTALQPIAVSSAMTYHRRAMALEAGQKLAHYEIVEPIGKGGMGEVYKARDTRLGRTVAIKVLPPHLAESPERKARFEREAKAISQINHPNICTLHDVGAQDGVDYIVMEHIEGETLSERLQSGALSLDEALKYGIQIADGLEKAHRVGIVHRDLKPGNIMLTKSGVKLLDFGLAKWDERALHTDSELPTKSKNLTQEGVVVGTLSYMSPEQVEGKHVDSRSDLFSFGAVLYEMLTGVQAFDGDSQAVVIAAILNADPTPLATRRPGTPAALDRCTRKCLSKDAEERWQTAHDLKDEMNWIAEPGDAGVAWPMPNRAKTTPRYGFAMVLGAAIGSLVFWMVQDRELETPRMTHTVIPLGSGESLLRSDFVNGSSFAISPDGLHLAYVALDETGSRIVLRRMDDSTAIAVRGTEGGVNPFFSPDSQWLGFHADGELKKVQFHGGAPSTVVSYPNVVGASWGPDDRIVFAPGNAAGLLRVSASGGVTETLTTPSNHDREKSHRFPEVLPGGEAVLYTLGTADISSWDDGLIAVLSLRSGEQSVLIEGGTNPQYASSGHILFGRAGSIFAVPFDVSRLAVTGDPAPVVEGVMTSTVNGQVLYDVSREGLLAYVSGSGDPPQRSLVWVGRNGHEEEITSPDNARPFVRARLAPGGKTAAVTVDGANGEIWLWSFDRGTLTRSAWGWDHNYMAWSPDGRRLTINTNPAGKWNLFSYLADGSGELELFVHSENGLVPGSWSPDGEYFAYSAINASTGMDVRVVSKDGTARTLLQTAANEGSPEFSPDGRVLAYTSDESGRTEVYLRPFPGPGAKRQVSSDGGEQPAWNPSGRELFYIDENRMVVVDVDGRDFENLELSTPRLLFERRVLNTAVGTWPRDYDIAPDGRRFLMVAPRQNLLVTQIQIVTSWFQDLDRRVPGRD